MGFKPRKATAHDEPRRLGGRRASTLALGIPALLTLGFAMRPQSGPDPYVFLTDRELDQRIEAYLPLVKMTEPHMLPGGHVEDAEARRLAAAWIEGAERGELKPLRPLVLSESIYEGATGQILAAQRSVANTLMIRGERRIREGQLRDGAEDLVAAARVYRPTQYSDIESATLTSLQVRRALMSLRVAAKAMGPTDRTWLVSSVHDLGSDSRRLGELALTTRRLYEEQLIRAGKAVPDEGKLAKLSRLRQAASGEETATIRDVREQIKDAQSDPDLRPLVAALRRVMASEITTQDRIAELVRLGGGAPAEGSAK